MAGHCLAALGAAIFKQGTFLLHNPVGLYIPVVLHNGPVERPVVLVEVADDVLPAAHLHLLLVELLVGVPQPPLQQLPLVVPDRLRQLVQLTADVGAARLVLRVGADLKAVSISNVTNFRLSFLLFMIFHVSFDLLLITAYLG